VFRFTLEATDWRDSGLTLPGCRRWSASISFNHGIGEILTAILGAGLRLVAFEEHRMPATYTLQAVQH
jgi:hypothetical protein